ncbi:MAG: pyrroloquinoline quinone biosynthesis protein PqqB [Acetobacteraceae bacterium]
MRVIVLGAAAGGGFPQWNANNAACRRARADDRAAQPRTQCSIALSGDGENWVVVNASPDLRGQIEATPALHPSGGLRHSPIREIVLTGGEVDAIAGLLHLRERQSLTLFATERVHSVLRANPIFDVLSPEHVTRRSVTLDRPFRLRGGLVAELFAVPGKIPLYLEQSDVAGAMEDTAGLRVSDSAGAVFTFVPGCASMPSALAESLRGAALVFFDGTLWTDEEMIREGSGSKTGQRMGHMSVDATMAAFRDLGVRRKVLIHINNSNPLLLDDSPERAIAEGAGWEVAYDGMEIVL